MHKVKDIFKISIGIVVLLSFVGCSTMVTVDSEPKGVEVYINQKYVGTTPVEKKLSNFAANTYNLRLKKDGYKTLETQLEKEVKAGAVVGGIFLLGIPLLWVYGPQKEHYYKLEPGDSSSNASAVIVNNRDDVEVYLDGKLIDQNMTEVPAGKCTLAFAYNDEICFIKNVDLVAGYTYRLR